MSSHPRWSWRLPSLRPSRKLAWVLALALLLPLAQALATAHTITHHVAAATQDESGSATLIDAPCALCLGAATLGSGALPSAQAPLPSLLKRHVAPTAAADSTHTSAHALGYLSRAPPVSLI